MNDDRDTRLGASEFDRRRFLKVLGAAFSAAALPEMLAGCGDAALPHSVLEVEALTSRQTIAVVRPEDHLVLTLGFVNLKRSAAGQLVKLAATFPAFLIVDFPSQAIVEDTAAGSAIDPQFFANAWLGGTTRLVFRLPDDYAPVPFQLSAILGVCGTSSVVVSDPMATSSAGTVPAPTSGASASTSTSRVSPLVDAMSAALCAAVDPAASARKMATDGTLAAVQSWQTAYPGSTGKPKGFDDRSVSIIELPYRLQLSPNSTAGWSHATAPVPGRSGACEIWHTVLGARTVPPTAAGAVDERNAYLRTARALYTRDFDLGCSQSTLSCTPAADVAWNPPPPAGVRALAHPSVLPAQRARIVQLSSQATDARPIQINRLMLSSLGGYLDAHGEWNDPSHTVDAWVHKMAGGRENFVQVVSTGVLLPFGNVVTKIKVTKRNENPDLGPIGTLFAFDVFIVRTPVASYRPDDFKAQASRDTLLSWPFTSVKLLETQFVAQASDLLNYWPIDMSGLPIMVPSIGYDQRGRAINFSVPFYFVGPQKVPVTDATVHDYRAALDTPPHAAGRPQPPGVSVHAPPPNQANSSLSLPLAGQRIAYAYSKRDDTTFATRTLYVDVAPVAGESFPYVPVVTGAVVDVEAVQSYTGGQPVTVTYHPRYTGGGAGFDTTRNRSQLLFGLTTPLDIDVRNQPNGGTAFVAPNMKATAISRTTGPSSDWTTATSPLSAHALAITAAPGSIVDGGFDPASYLNQAVDKLDKVRLFGVFRLIDIIKAVDPHEAATDLAGLTKELEHAALKYAPKFVTEALNEVEKILSTIAEVKGWIESIWTNIKELLGDDYVVAVGEAVDAGNADPGVDAVIRGALGSATGIGSGPWGAVAGKLTVTLIRAHMLYASLVAALDHLEHLEIDALAAAAPAKGSLPQIVADGIALKDAIVDLATFAVRGNLDAKDAVVAAANQAGAQGALKVTNALIHIVPGLSDGFLSKFKVLQEVIGDVNDVVALAGRLKKIYDEAQQAMAALRDLTVKLDWQPKIGSYYLPGTDWLIFRPATQHALSLSTEIRSKAKDGKQAGIDVSCRLDQFDLCLGPLDDQGKSVIAMQFDHIAFTAQAGKKPDVDVKINGIVFGGPLSFLETLRKLIPLDGFSDPPYLHVDSQGIHAGFSLHVPNVAIGIFSMENIAISATLEIPFFADGGPSSALRFTFSFCDKDHPFIITISMMGGGGYFVMALTPAGIESIEASICVGALIAINLLDIAQGSVSITVGITFTVKDVQTAGNVVGKDVSLTAFLRVHGQLDVLGIVTVSLDVNLSMVYDVTTKVLTADGTLKVDVSLLFFSAHVEVAFHKEFHTCNNDPTLRELMPPDGMNVSQYWNDYCDAYAA